MAEVTPMKKDGRDGDTVNAVIDVKKKNISSSRLPINNPLNTIAYSEEHEHAARIIQKVWRDYGVQVKRLKTRHLWKKSIFNVSDRRKRFFASILVFANSSIQLIVYFINFFWGKYLKGTFAVLGLYATLLIWSLTLPVIKPWQTKVSLFVSVLSYVFVSLIAKIFEARFDERYIVGKIALLILIPLLYFMLE